MESQIVLEFTQLSHHRGSEYPRNVCPWMHGIMVPARTALDGRASTGSPAPFASAQLAHSVLVVPAQLGRLAHTSKLNARLPVGAVPARRFSHVGCGADRGPPSASRTAPPFLKLPPTPAGSLRPPHIRTVVRRPMTVHNEQAVYGLYGKPGRNRRRARRGRGGPRGTGKALYLELRPSVRFVRRSPGQRGRTP